MYYRSGVFLFGGDSDDLVKCCDNGAQNDLWEIQKLTTSKSLRKLLQRY